MKRKSLRVAMISVHSSPLGEIGTRDTGGMSIYVRALAAGLAGLGHCVDIFTRRRRRDQPRCIRSAENVRVIHVDAGGWEPLPPPALSRHVSEFVRGMEHLRSSEDRAYDLVHSHYWLSGLVGHRIARWWRIPHVVLFHTLGLLKNRALEAPVEPETRVWTEKALCGQCERVIATTEVEGRELAELYDAPSRKIRVIPCGVDLMRFKPQDKQKARGSLGLTRDEAIVLYVGRFDPIKGISELLGAMAMMQTDRPVKLILVGGDGDSAAEARAVRALTDRLDLGDRAVFVGRVAHKHLPAYYGAADVLAVPSHYESFGLVALEALACGTPVVAPSVGVMSMLLADGCCGALVKARDPKSLADGLRGVLAARKAGRYEAEDIRARVISFDWAVIAERVEAEYLDLLSEAGRWRDNGGWSRIDPPRNGDRSSRDVEVRQALESLLSRGE